MNANKLTFHLCIIGLCLVLIVFVGAFTARLLLWFAEQGWSLGGWILNH